MNKSMMVVRSVFDNRPTFKLIPLNKECPYLECIYNQEHKVFALLYKDKVSKPILIDVLGETGKPKKNKNSEDLKERRIFDVPHEFYLEDIESIKDFLEQIAINPQKAEEYLVPLEEPIKKKDLSEHPVEK